jgi:hypothetical protein
MRLNLKITFLFLFITNFCLAQDWVETTIPGIGTIEFPEDAEFFSQDGALIYKVENNDAYYLVTIVQLDPGYTSEIESNLDEFYQGNLKGTEDASGGKITEKQRITIDGIKAMDVRISGVVNPELPSLLFKRFIYLSPFNISVDFRPKKTDETQFLGLKDKFFNSLILETNSEDASIAIESIKTEESAFKKGYAVGYVIGKIAFWVFLVLIAILVFYFIIRLIRPKKKKEPKTVASKLVTKQKIECANCRKANSTEAKYCSQCGYTLPRD